METNDLLARQQQLKKLFALAQFHGIAKNQNEFAQFIGYNPVNLSKALKGDPKFLTDKFITNAERAFYNNNIDIHAPFNIQQGDNNTNNQTTLPPAPTQATDNAITLLSQQLQTKDQQIAELLRQNAQLINIITLDR